MTKSSWIACAASCALVSLLSTMAPLRTRASSSAHHRWIDGLAEAAASHRRGELGVFLDERARHAARGPPHHTLRIERGVNARHLVEHERLIGRDRRFVRGNHAQLDKSRSGNRSYGNHLGQRRAVIERYDAHAKATECHLCDGSNTGCHGV